MKNELLNAFNTLAISNDFAVGNDLVFVPDFKAAFNPLFKNKVYTKNEIAYCDLFDDALLRYASAWAAKEAVYKAIKQLDPKPLPFKKIEIVHEKIAGRPQVILPESAGQFMISLTISHDGDYVWAAAFAQINQSPA